MRNVPHVPAIFELAKVLRKMLRADVNVRPVDATLQSGPEAFNSVHAAAGRRVGIDTRLVVAVT